MEFKQVDIDILDVNVNKEYLFVIECESRQRFFNIGRVSYSIHNEKKIDLGTYDHDGRFWPAKSIVAAFELPNKYEL